MENNISIVFGTGPSAAMRGISITEVSDILQSRFVLMTGGISRDGCPLITFPDATVDAQTISDEDYKKVMSFLANIPTLSDADNGYVVIIDRRKDKWTSVKTLLLKISALFPGYVREVLVLRPDGFFQRTFMELGQKWLHDNFQFEVLILQTLEELHRKVDPSHLTVDLGGTFMFDAKEWVQQRFAIESYGKHCSELAARLSDIAKSLDELEMPNDVAATEELIATHLRLKDETVDEIMDARNHGDTLLGCFRGKGRRCAPETIRDGRETPNQALGHDRLVHLTSTERLMAQLGEANMCFNQFWERHQKRLNDCLQLRKFEEDFKELQYRLECIVNSATAVPRCGGSAAELEILLADLKKIESDCEGPITRADNLRKEGAKLVATSGAADSVLPKCAELERMALLYRTAIAERRDSLARSADLHHKVEQLKKWCSDGLDLLADGLDTHLAHGGTSTIHAGLLALETFLRSGNGFNFKDPSEFRKTYDDVMCPATKDRVQDALRRAADVQDLCSRRRSALQEVAVASASAALSLGERSMVSHLSAKKVVLVTAAAVDPQSPAKATKAVEAPACPPMSAESSRRSSTDGKHSRKRSFSIKGGIKGMFLRKKREGGDGEEDNEAVPAVELGQGEERDLHKAVGGSKRSSVMNELVETEKVFVSELREIVQGYVSATVDPAFSHLLPAQLAAAAGGRDVLFGNVEQLLAFHGSTFLADLLECRHTPALVGRCFTARVEEFKLYFAYCQNKPNSDKLLQEIGDHDAFLKECQQRVGHLLPLGAYLLKPIQRITKYQLLLREMLHYMAEGEDEEDGAGEVQQALDCMLALLKHANDLMHHLSITGVEDTSAASVERGKLLMQGPLSVSISRRKDRMPSFRLRSANRHAFLYEKVLLFCKPKEEQSSQFTRGGSIRDHYRYKSSVTVSCVEAVAEGGDARRLELRLRGAGDTYSLQAASGAARDEWLRELRRALLLLLDDGSVASAASANTAIALSLARSKVGDSKVPCPQVEPKHGDSAAATNLGGGDTDEGWSSGEETHSDSEVTETDCQQTVYPCLMTFSLAARVQSQGGDGGRDGDELLLSEGDLVECMSAAPLLAGRTSGDSWMCVRIPGTDIKGWLPRSCLLPYTAPRPITQEESGCSISSGSSCQE